MKRRLHNILSFFAVISSLFVAWSLTSCAEKEDTTPSNADSDRLETLIDNSIAEIASFKEAYGTYILYHFDKNLDFAYQFEQASSWNNAGLTAIGHDDAEAAVEMLCSKVFSCYNDDYKKEFYPRKLLLVGDIASASELGLSVPANGHHTAVANINSVTIAKMTKSQVAEAVGNEDEMAAISNEIHRALLADYLVKARGEYPVGNDYFSFSQKEYASLMSSSRKTAAQLVKEDENFFYNHGFFFPDEEEATYFPGAEDDILAYIRNMITMDGETANTLLDMPLMAGKMHLITTGLQDMGVDVMKINPNMEQFLKMEYVQPAVIFANDVVTDNPTATLTITILRGSHELSHLMVSVNGGEEQKVDLSAYNKIRVVIPVELYGLVKGANSVTIKLYEEGRDRVASMLTTGVSYATMDQVIGFTIKGTDDHEDVYRRLKIAVGHGGDIDDEENPDLTTIAFEKHGYLDKYFMEIGGEYRYWKMYKHNGHVESIVQYMQDGFNENYTAPLYRITGKYSFVYNDEGELTEVVFTDENEVAKKIVTDVQYMAGRIVRYNYDGKEYKPTYATVDGITTRVDCLDETMSGTLFGFDGTEDLNPYFMPELPAVIPGSISEVPLQLLYSQYLFKSLGNMWNNGWTRNLEEKTNSAEVTIDGVTWTYRFKLK